MLSIKQPRELRKFSEIECHKNCFAYSHSDATLYEPHSSSINTVWRHGRVSSLVNLQSSSFQPRRNGIKVALHYASCWWKKGVSFGSSAETVWRKCGRRPFRFLNGCCCVLSWFMYYHPFYYYQYTWMCILKKRKWKKNRSERCEWSISVVSVWY